MEIDKLCKNIVDSCIVAGECFPVCKKRKKLPYWGSKVKPFKDDAIFWRNIWLQCNKPTSGIIYDLMKRTKQQYHYAVRRLKRRSDDLIKSRMAEAIVNNKSRDFWSEVKKINSTGTNISSNIGDYTNAYDIAALFANKYDVLYNSVPSDAENMNNITAQIKQRLTDNHLTEITFTEADVCKAVRSIKKDKADDSGKLFSNHIIYGSRKLYDAISVLFNSMLMHGYTPVRLLNSNIVSIPKDNRGDLSCDENYRGISMCSSLFKLFELLLIQKQSDKLGTSDMQFAYKSGHSTTMSTLIFKEVINYYFQRQSEVYCCFIDASKAFDRIRHDLLFEILLERKVNPFFIRILMDSYSRQTIQTSWLGTKSRSFKCVNGVRQGGILSPLLYSIYNDVLLNRLKENSNGCWIGHTYFGALSYADDLCILSPTLSGLENMLTTCEKYGDEYDVLFNPKKTKCMKFSKQDYDESKLYKLKLCDKDLSWVKTFKYLGNWVTYRLNEETEISRKMGIFYGNVNNLCSTFRGIGLKHLFTLFNSYCCHLYGSQAWRFNDKYVERLYTAWNKAVRHLSNLHAMTHTRFLPFVANMLHIKDQVYFRSFNMIANMIDSKNLNVRFMARDGIGRFTSIIGDNLHQIRTYCDRHVMSPSEFKMLVIEKRNNDYTIECHMILELLDVSEGIKFVPGFAMEDLNDILVTLCVS